jgi:hypothetical protein
MKLIEEKVVLVQQEDNMADFKHNSELIEEVLKETEDFFYEFQKQREKENGTNKQ